MQARKEKGKHNGENYIAKEINRSLNDYFIEEEEVMFQNQFIYSNSFQVADNYHFRSLIFIALVRVRLTINGDLLESHTCVSFDTLLTIVFLGDVKELL